MMAVNGEAAETPSPQDSAAEGHAAGFDDPVLQSQAMFRCLLDAMARPGRIVKCPESPAVPAPLLPTAAAAALTLLDYDTPLWLDPPAADAPAAAEFLKFHCGCPLVTEPTDAAFALITNPAEMLPLAAFAAGSESYPDRSATLLLQVERIDDSRGVILLGPGIETTQKLQAKPLPAGFWDQVRANHARFPLGVDLILFAEDRIVALPRSTRVEV